MADKANQRRQASSRLGPLTAFVLICSMHVAILEGTIRNLMARCPNYGVVWGVPTLHAMDFAFAACLMVALACLCATYVRDIAPKFDPAAN